jgi:hypothetical protein
VTPQAIAVAIVTTRANRSTLGSKPTWSSRGSASRPIWRGSHAEPGEQQPRDTAEPRQHKRFDHQQPREPARAGAKRRPDRKLLHATRGADDDQVRDVDARNEQHEPDGNEKKLQEMTRRRSHIFPQRHGHEAARPHFGPLALHGSAQDLELGLCLLHRHARSQPTDHGQAIVLGKCVALEVVRQPYVHRADERIFKARGGDPSHFVGFGTQSNRRADYRRIAVEPSTPHCVAEHQAARTEARPHIVVTWRSSFVFDLESTSVERLGAEGTEIIARDQQDAQALRVAAVGDVESQIVSSMPGAHVHERRRLVAQRSEVRRRHTTFARSGLRFFLIDTYELAWLRKRQRRQHHRMSDAEHRRRPTDSDRECGDSNGRKARTSSKLSNRVAEILLRRAPMLPRSVPEQVTEYLPPKADDPVGGTGSKQQRHLLAVLIAKLAWIQCQKPAVDSFRHVHVFTPRSSEGW